MWFYSIIILLLDFEKVYYNVAVHDHTRNTFTKSLLVQPVHHRNLWDEERRLAFHGHQSVGEHNSYIELLCKQNLLPLALGLKVEFSPPNL